MRRCGAAAKDDHEVFVFSHFLNANRYPLRWKMLLPIADSISMARAWLRCCFADLFIDFVPQSTDVSLGSGNCREDRPSYSRIGRVRFVHTRRISHSPSYESPSRSAKGRAAHKP
jgi:hypothetical protein